MNERELFQAALDLDPAQRQAYLDQACGIDTIVRARIEALLNSHASESLFLNVPALEQLHPSTPDDGSTVTVHRYQAEDVGSDETTPDEDAGDLDFLEPSNHPGALGRIGQYEVLQILGKGGFGIVFRALDVILQRVVAVKVLAPQMASHSPARKRFLREAQSSAQVRHDNVVKVYAVEEEPSPYLVMEFIQGETLQQRLNRKGPLAVMEVVQIGRQIAEGLAAAHATGLIHRDIKPANILIMSGPSEQVKITDFGLARAADDASLTQSGVVAGTPMYMAPEQASADELDHRADLFSLGSVLYSICSGRPPFRASSTLAVLKRVVEDAPRPIREIIPETPQWLCDIISKLHAKNPEERFGTAKEVADLLERGFLALQQPGVIEPPQVAVVEKVSVPVETFDVKPEIGRRRFRTRRWAAAAAVLLMLFGILGFTEATGVTDFRGTVIRLVSPEGTLVVEVDDPGVSVQIDGSDLVISGAGPKEIRLMPGSHTVEARKDGNLVSQKLITITKNGREVVRVRLEPTDVKVANADPKKVPEEKLSPRAVEGKTLDPDRRGAEYVLRLGGTVKVNVRDREQEIKDPGELPGEQFQLVLVGLPDNLAVTDNDLTVFQGCQHLKRVYLWGSKNVSNVGLRNFSQCKQLTLLGMGGTALTDSGLESFKEFTNLETLHVSGTPVTAEGLSNLRGCKNLQHINLHWCAKFKDKDVPELLNWQNLSELILDETGITDAGVAQLSALKKLSHLRILKTQVTMMGVEKLAKALPMCKITWDGGTIEPK